jgi:hypothetical protein
VLPVARHLAEHRGTAGGDRTHHQNEDEILWPVLAATAGPAVDLAPLTDDHRTIRAAADRASQALASFRVAPGTLAELHALFSQLRDLLDEHIADEEQQILAATRRYLPADVYRWCEQQTRRKAALPGLRFTAPWLARHAQPGEMDRLLAVGGCPAQIVVPPPAPGYAQLERQAFGTSRNH